MSQTMKALQAMIREGITVKDACARFGISPAAISKGRLHPSVKMTMQFEIETSRARAAELEAALKAARDALEFYSDPYVAGQPATARKAIAKINEVLHD